MTTTPAESTRGAIELMTAWSARPDGPPDLLVDCLCRHVDGCPPEHGLASAVELIMGMTTLCGALLVMREHESGVRPEGTLRELAVHYAHY
jgi:hypothetical protein